MQFEHNNLYLGVGYKKKYKAPTDHVLCMKHPKIQNMKSKHILYLCADDSKSMYQWLTGIRMAKVFDWKFLSEHQTSLVSLKASTYSYLIIRIPRKNSREVTKIEEKAWISLFIYLFIPTMK